MVRWCSTLKPICRYTYHGFDFSCIPPWHFFGWYYEESAKVMLPVAKQMDIPLRVGERVWISFFNDKVCCDVWLDESVTDLSDFWRVVNTLKEKNITQQR